MTYLNTPSAPFHGRIIWPFEMLSRAIKNSVKARRDQYVTAKELGQLSPRLLKDVGISRLEVEQMMQFPTIRY